MAVVFQLTETQLASDEIRALWTPIATEFFVESGYPGTFNPDHFWAFWTQALGLGIAKWFAVADESGNPVGAFGALFPDDPLTGNPTAVEQFWFVTKSMRGSGKIGLSLFRAYERECDERKVKTRWMGHINEHNAPTLGRFYRREGYGPADQLFRKDTF